MSIFAKIIGDGFSFAKINDSRLQFRTQNRLPGCALKMLRLSFRLSVAQHCIHLCLRDAISVTFKAIIRNHLRLMHSN